MIVPDWAGYLRYRDAFESVLDKTLYTIEWLDWRVLQPGCFLFVGTNAGLITETKQYPTGACDMAGMIAAGDLDEIVGVLIPRAEAFAKDIGCVGALIESREGWSRVLKSKGYAPHQLTLRKVF